MINSLKGLRIAILQNICGQQRLTSILAPDEAPPRGYLYSGILNVVLVFVLSAFPQPSSRMKIVANKKPSVSEN